MLTIDGNTLTISEVVAVARHGEDVELTSQAKENIRRARAWVQGIIAAGEPVYGINTGFGIFSDRRCPKKSFEPPCSFAPIRWLSGTLGRV